MPQGAKEPDGEIAAEKDAQKKMEPSHSELLFFGEYTPGNAGLQIPICFSCEDVVYFAPVNSEVVR